MYINETDIYKIWFFQFFGWQPLGGVASECVGASRVVSSDEWVVGVLWNVMKARVVAMPCHAMPPLFSQLETEWVQCCGLLLSYPPFPHVLLCAKTCNSWYTYIKCIQKKELLYFMCLNWIFRQLNYLRQPISISNSPEINHIYIFSTSQTMTKLHVVWTPAKKKSDNTWNMKYNRMSDIKKS